MKQDKESKCFPRSAINTCISQKTTVPVAQCFRFASLHTEIQWPSLLPSPSGICAGIMGCWLPISCKWIQRLYNKLHMSQGKVYKALCLCFRSLAIVGWRWAQGKTCGYRENWHPIGDVVVVWPQRSQIYGALYLGWSLLCNVQGWVLGLQKVMSYLLT